MKYGPHLVRLDVCCNDPDDGSFAARAAAISLQDSLLEIAADDMIGPVFREWPDHVQLGRRRFASNRVKEWYGNWCWNAYWLDVDDAVEFLAHAHALGRFNADMGEERLFNRWHLGEPFNAAARDLFGRLLVEADINEPRERLA